MRFASEKSSGWLFGAWGVGFASTSGIVRGETVQITQGENFVSSDATSIRDDLTGDGMTDLPGLSITKRAGNFIQWVGSFRNSYYSNRAGLFSRQVDLGAAYYRAWYGDPSDPAENPVRRYHVWEYGGTNDHGTDPKLKRFLSPIAFSDRRINQGAATNGFLEVRLTSRARMSNKVQLVRLVFDDTNTARPEGITIGGTQKEWVAPDFSVERALLLRELRQLKKKLRKAKRRGATRRAKKIRQRIREVKRELRSLP